MKKTIILLSLLSVLLLTGCNKNNPGATPATGNDADQNCFTLCHETVPELCEDEIIDYQMKDVDVMVNDTIYNDEYCESQCTSWTDEVRACVANADTCEQLGPKADYCITNEPESPFVTDPEVEVDKKCATACKNYSDCTKYTEGAGPQDVADAYSTCMQECGNWSQENIACMAKAKVSNPTDCMAVTMCGLNQYNGAMDALDAEE